MRCTIRRRGCSLDCIVSALMCLTCASTFSIIFVLVMWSPHRRITQKLIPNPQSLMRTLNDVLGRMISDGHTPDLAVVVLDEARESSPSFSSLNA